MKKKRSPLTTGKSSIVAKAAKKAGLQVIEVPFDTTGMPKMLGVHKFVKDIGICDARSILPDLRRHEQIHQGLAHLHGLRPDAPDAAAFNQACDDVVNRLLTEAGIKFNKKGGRVS